MDEFNISSLILGVLGYSSTFCGASCSSSLIKTSNEPLPKIAKFQSEYFRARLIYIGSKFKKPFSFERRPTAITRFESYLALDAGKNVNALGMQTTF